MPLVATPRSISAGQESILNGEVDWVYEEELETRSNYFWSPDSKNIAYLQMNETRFPQYPITDWIPDARKVEWQRYPQPGDPNPDVHLGVVPRARRQADMGASFPSMPATITFRASAGLTARRCGSKRSAAITSIA